MIKYYTKACNFYFGSISKKKIKSKLSLPLHGNNLVSFDEIENLINKDIYPADKQDLKVEDNKGSALSAMGLKPKIVH